MLTQRVDLLRLRRAAVGGDLEVAEVFAGLAALVQGKQQQLMDDQGRQVTAMAVVYLEAAAPIDTKREDWRIRWEERDWEVVAVHKEIDAANGQVHHLKVGIR